MDPHVVVGEWTMARRVVDQLGGQYGTVSGELVVADDGDGLRWHERGTLTWEGGRYPVSRTLQIRLVDGDWWVLFSDGRRFHPWQPGTRVAHPCAADHYDGLIVLDRAGTRMRTLWDVRGPAKRQRLITRFRRRQTPDVSVAPVAGDRGRGLTR